LILGSRRSHVLSGGDVGRSMHAIRVASAQ
jgi:hypothetical protein